MTVEALKDQRTIPKSREMRKDIENVTKRQIDYLRSMLHEQMPHAKFVRAERKYRERKTRIGSFVDTLALVWFEHDGRPLPPKMKELRDFNLIERVAKDAHDQNYRELKG